MYTSCHQYLYQDACNSSFLVVNAPHCLGGGRSGPSGSIRDLRNVFPFIRFVVTITNSTDAAKGGKESLALKLLAQINKKGTCAYVTFLKNI